MKKFMLAVSAALLLVLAAAGCDSNAKVTSDNLSKAADNFEINRRIVFFNGITDKYLLTIEGRCSINVDKGDKQLEVTCKIGDNAFKKHFLGLSDNVTYFIEQLDAVNVSEYRYRVIFRPEQIVPDIDMRTSGG